MNKIDDKVINIVKNNITYDSYSIINRSVNGFLISYIESGLIFNSDNSIEVDLNNNGLQDSVWQMVFPVRQNIVEHLKQ